jgi:hypothetical protein
MTLDARRNERGQTTQMTRLLKVFATSFGPGPADSILFLTNMTFSPSSLFPLHFDADVATVLNPNFVGKKGNNGLVRLKAGVVLPADGQPPGTMMLRGHDAEVTFDHILASLIYPKLTAHCNFMLRTGLRRPVESQLP